MRERSRTKFIFVTGGVVSSLGKGLASASIAALLESRGLRVSMVKMDPYINVDPGTMNPYQHGEVFVTDDGAETDLDLGHYERYCSTRMSQRNNITTGRVYIRSHQQRAARRLPGRDRAGDPPYHRRDQTAHPGGFGRLRHRASARSEALSATSRACRSWKRFVSFVGIVGKEDVLYVHLTLVPFISTAGEVKTKPTQHSVKELTGLGIQPDVLLCRTDRVPRQEDQAEDRAFLQRREKMR